MTTTNTTPAVIAPCPLFAAHVDAYFAELGAAEEADRIAAAMFATGETAATPAATFHPLELDLYLGQLELANIGSGVPEGREAWQAFYDRLAEVAERNYSR